MPIVFLQCLLYLLISVPAFTRPAECAEITPAFEFARAGDKILGACSYAIPVNYHAYANEPGESGQPTQLDFTLEGEGAMPVLYPAGTKEADSFDPSITVFVYKGKVMLLAILPSAAGGSMYAASLEMLLCSSRHCIPSKRTFSGQIPQSIPQLEEVGWKDAAQALLALQVASFGAVSREEGAAPPPLKSGPDDTPQISGQGSANLENDTEKAGLPQAEKTSDFELDLEPRYANARLEIFGLGKALMLGLLAGLLLNAMPCVLPVLTLKVSGLLMLGNLPDKQKLHLFRIHNLCFAGGVITFFIFLAFLLGAAGLMWGQLYQNETVLLLMLILVFLMGLSMLGVFTLPVIDLRIDGNSKNPKLQSYCTGLVSTFLATPCSGPLLGGALAWAFTQPQPIILAVFLSIGMGMSLPYLAFSAWPGMARILPRPGRWMYVFEHILGFLLLGTSIYLLSILPREKCTRILCVLLTLATGAWLWGKFCGLDAPRARRALMGALGILTLCGAIFWVMSPIPQGPLWKNFSPESFVSSFGKKNMLVEFTADWCPNCKFLEATVLSSPELRSWSKGHELELVRVDLTRHDPYAQKLLKMLGSRSIPLTALFAKGDGARKPLILRDIYTIRNLEKAIAETFGAS